MAKGDWAVSGDGGDGKPPLRVGWVEWREGKGWMALAWGVGLVWWFSFYILGLYFGDFNLSSTFLNIMIRAEHSRLKKTSEITISKVSWLKNDRG
ncbi:hypothetical protein IC582_012441 [Cucumis melo]